MFVCWCLFLAARGALFVVGWLWCCVLLWIVGSSLRAARCSVCVAIGVDRCVMFVLRRVRCVVVVFCGYCLLVVVLIVVCCALCLLFACCVRVQCLLMCLCCSLFVVCCSVFVALLFVDCRFGVCSWSGVAVSLLLVGCCLSFGVCCVVCG